MTAWFSYVRDLQFCRSRDRALTTAASVPFRVFIYTKEIALLLVSVINCFVELGRISQGV